MKNGMIVDEDGTKRWYEDGKRHREDGPAVEWANGDKEWYLNGLWHREDGPAKEWAYDILSGYKYKEWYVNGELHREDGPALEWADGRKEWWINGEYHREDGPAIQAADGSKYWYLSGVKVPKYVVTQPETITLERIKKARNNEVRAIMIERYGWQRYLTDSKAKMIDKRDNAVENTKEALFVTRSFGNRLVVTCPTGRVFTLGVPNNTKTCEAAQQWLGNSTEEINVIGRT